MLFEMNETCVDEREEYDDGKESGLNFINFSY